MVLKLPLSTKLVIIPYSIKNKTIEHKMSNRLEKEDSPYLQQHKENPVDWWPWCNEAFKKAEAENKAIFISIGYSSCHWCHVMEETVFENQECADILNDGFVCIKVDREERPDIDKHYQEVHHQVQLAA